jgi:hypothetical protein
MFFMMRSTICSTQGLSQPAGSSGSSSSPQWLQYSTAGVWLKQELSWQLCMVLHHWLSRLLCCSLYCVLADLWRMELFEAVHLPVQADQDCGGNIGVLMRQQMLAARQSNAAQCQHWQTQNLLRANKPRHLLSAGSVAICRYSPVPWQPRGNHRPARVNSDFSQLRQQARPALLTKGDQQLLHPLDADGQLVRIAL